TARPVLDAQRPDHALPRLPTPQADREGRLTGCAGRAGRSAMRSNRCAGRAAPPTLPRVPIPTVHAQPPVVPADPKDWPRAVLPGRFGSAAMTGSRLALVIILAIGFTSPAFGQGGLLNRKQKPDAPRVRQLTEIVRLDPSEKKRQAAVEELAGADPRVQLD